MDGLTRVGLDHRGFPLFTTFAVWTANQGGYRRIAGRYAESVPSEL